MIQRTPWIAHVDMDCFFVAVERRINPELNGKAVAVGGQSSRAVISSASYEARKFGVRSAMSVWQARKLCPHLIMVSSHYSEYSKYSRLIFSELKKIAPVVEQVSIDEAYLDFTGCESLYASREEAAQKVKNAITQVSGLASTVGVATNKLVAKVASDLAKPNGLMIVEAGDEEKFMRPLSISRIPGIGNKTVPVYECVGIKTCADLLDKPKDWLIGKFGPDVLRVAELAAGKDSRPVSAEREESKSIGGEITFEGNISSREKLEAALRETAEDVAHQMRSENLKARTVQIKYRHPDFSTFTRAKTLAAPTFISREIGDVAIELLDKNVAPRVALRLLGLSCRNFVPSDESPAQLDFFSDTKKVARDEKVEHLKDELRRRFGHDVLVKPTAPSRPKDKGK